MFRSITTQQCANIISVLQRSLVASENGVESALAIAITQGGRGRGSKMSWQ
jgi:hypothetical protein